MWPKRPATFYADWIPDQLLRYYNKDPLNNEALGANQMKKNLRFNRWEHRGEHHYVKEFQAPILGTSVYDGYIKCKLVHHERFSLVIPDQIYLTLGSQTYWFQPFFFTANFISFFEYGGSCTYGIDLAFGARIQVHFSNSQLLTRFPDGSFFYKCRITAIAQLWRYATGKAVIKNNVPYLNAFHHTDRKAEKGIRESNEFWSSKWNIQGTKKLSNISYLYLTPLDGISCDSDLQEVAMASDGRIALRLDQNQTNDPDENLSVYREDTTNRTQSIACWVRADHLSSQHVYRHTPPIGAIHYEIVCPFILRLGVAPETTVQLNKTTLSPQQPKMLEYVVVGDATTIAGLRAPYDEELTDHILKIDTPADGDDIITHWQQYPNANLFQGISVEQAEFLPAS